MALSSGFQQRGGVVSQHRGVQRGKQGEQNLRQNEACSGILENREGKAGRRQGGLKR